MSDRRLIWVSLLFALIVLTVHSIAIHPWMLDDAFISFRYAENLCDGHGLVFNSGERVEGYTCFLWVLLLALGKTLGVDTVFFSKLLGILASLGTLVLLSRAHRFSGQWAPRTSAVATLFLGTCGVFTAWATSGMEVALFTFAVLLTVLLHLRARERGPRSRDLCLLGILGAFLAMIRPEGLLIFGVLFADHLVLALRRRDWRILYLGLLFALIYLPYVAWRFSYYGYPLPNTFYAKVGYTGDQIIRGFRYAAFFASPALLLLVPTIGATFFSGEWLSRYRGLYLLPVLAGLYTAYVILVGGDIMPAFRFFAPILPLLCLLAAMGVAILARTRGAMVWAVALIAIYNLVQLGLDVEIRGHIVNDNVAVHGRETGLWLRENAPADAVVATNTGGTIPYYSRLRAIDMLGMNDLHIAHRDIPQLGRGRAGHEKGDGRYVLSKRPDYILFGGSLGSKYPHRLVSDQEIFQHREFGRFYTLKTVTLESGNKLEIYERTRFGQ